MRAAAYVRLSELVDTATSPQRQRADIAKWIEAHGYACGPAEDLYEDIAISAHPGVVRPGDQQMLASIDRYIVMVCWKLDGLLRSVRRDLGPLLGLLNQRQLRLHSVQEELHNTSPGGSS